MTDDLLDFEQKKEAYAQHLRTITNGLMEIARAEGRKHFTKNQLLRECYDVQDCEFKTLDEWHALGCYVKYGEHGYLFWQNDEPVLLFADWQLQVQQLSLFNNL